MGIQQTLLKGYGSKIPWQGNRGIFIGFSNTGSPGFTNDIMYVSIDTTGNTSDFGDSTFSGSSSAGLSGNGRGLRGGGGGDQNQDIIEYITISSTGNATDFGDLTHGDRANLSGCSNGERGIFGGGAPTSRDDIIDYVTIATTGNTSDFGDLIEPGFGTGCVNNDTRGVWGGGNTTYGFPGTKNVLQYITMATTGNATDFGDLYQHRFHTSGCSSKAGRGVFFGGGYTSPSKTNTIEYITIATTGNGTDFGDMAGDSAGTGSSKWNYRGTACANETRGIYAGGEKPGGWTDVIQYVTISQAVNATDFGDLPYAAVGAAGLSGD